MLVGTGGYLGGNRINQVGAVTSSATDGTQLTASASANTKGSYTQLVASTTFPTCAVIVNMLRGADASYHLVDIAVGGAGSEKVVIPDLFATSSWWEGMGHCHYWFPLTIPVSTRISARMQSDVGSGKIRVSVTLIGGSPQAFGSVSKIYAFGVDAANSAGTSIQGSSLTANTKSAWQELTEPASVPLMLRGCSIVSYVESITDDARFAVDYGIGADPNQKILIPNLLYSNDASVGFNHIYTGPFPLNLPIQDIWYRAQSQSTAADTFFSSILYGW